MYDECLCTSCFSSVGSGGLLPIVLCGDFNCKPNSPMLDFITSSFLNYSNMSAADIAGYSSKRGQSRVIPYPLLPQSMNIGPNCMYVENEAPCIDLTVSNGVEAKGSSSTGTTKNATPSDKKTGEVSTTGLSQQEASSPSVGANDFVESQNLNFKDGLDGGQSQKRYVKARSARGAKARGMSYSGVKISDFKSLLGSKSATDISTAVNGRDTSSCGGHAPNRTKLSGSPTVDDDGSNATEDDSDMEWEREKCQLDSSQSNVSTSAEGRTESRSNTEGGGSAVGHLSRSEPKRRAQCHMHGLITHPFKFITAYPQSRNSTPSTVTTFHQSAFETVDYIFFTPPTKRRAGFHLLSRKALPSTHVLLDLGPQPHRFLSSDHLLLQACFQLVNKSPRTN